MPFFIPPFFILHSSFFINLTLPFRGLGGHYEESPETHCCARGFSRKVAATYSPTGVQYHRRKRA